MLRFNTNSFFISFLKSILVMLLAPLLSSCSSNLDGLFVYQDRVTKLFGFKSSKGKVIIPAQFEKIMLHSEDHNTIASPFFSQTNKEYEFLVPVIKYGKLWQLGRDGTLKFETVYFDNGPDYYKEGLSRFIQDGKIGFHDLTGKIIVKSTYDYASPFINGTSIVCKGCYAQYQKNPIYKALRTTLLETPIEDDYKEIKGGKWGKINKKGIIVVPLIYNSLKDIPQ